MKPMCGANTEFHEERGCHLTFTPHCKINTESFSLKISDPLVTEFVQPQIFIMPQSDTRRQRIEQTFCPAFLFFAKLLDFNPSLYAQKPMMRGSPGPPSGMRGGPGPNFANINNIHQCEIHMKPRKRKNFLQAWLNKFPSRAKKIDVLARVIFPAIFAFFNMSYWTFYLTQEANTDVK